ncbi:MAG TPA: AAA family ATPase [Methanofastidiosum sp.]|nr:AAA family ATPase [Methanofastidiosum sp.]HNU61040.1 AAA family ATPase [Methanofastidiosum sp.]HOI77192.1 AAA family ATPase [Methanofastidiosum sp.]
MKLLITGVPGTGKTLISKKLAEMLNLNYINVGEFAKDNFDFPIEDDEIVIDEKEVEKKLKELENIVIDSHIPFKADKALILRCNPPILLERLRQRRYSEEKIKDNLLSEILDYEIYAVKELFSDEDIYEVLNETIDETMKEILEIIKGKGNSLKNGNHFNFLTEENIILINK